MRCFKAALPNSLLSVPVGLDNATRLFSSTSFTYLIRIVFLYGCLIAQCLLFALGCRLNKDDIFGFKYGRHTRSGDSE